MATPGMPALGPQGKGSISGRTGKIKKTHVKLQIGKARPERPNNGAGKHKMPAVYGFKWPRVTSAEIAHGSQEAGSFPGGMLGKNPDNLVSGRKGAPRIY